MVKKKEAGLVSVSFRQSLPLEILTEMQKCSLSYIEWGSDVHAACDDETNLYELVRMQESFGISCCSYGTYFRLGINAISELERYIYAAKILGTNVLRLWCGDKRSDMYSDFEKKRLFEQSVKAAELAKSYGAVLCMECHNNTFTETPEGAISLINAVNSGNFGMYWQPNQFRTFQQNLEYASMISEYVRNIHVFNWHERQQYPLSQAIQTWKKYLDCFSGEKYCLLEFMPDGRIESLKNESLALFEILKS